MTPRWFIVSALWVACSTEGKNPGHQSGPADDGSSGGTTDSGSSDSGEQSGGSCVFEDGGLATNTCVDAAPCQWTGTQASSYFGYAVDAHGDFNGDSAPDIAVGAPVADTAQADVGQVTLISGATVQETPRSVLATFSGSTPGEQVGTSLAYAGDVNGDGLGDLLVGARGWSTGALDRAGAAYLLLGAATDADSTTVLSHTARFIGESTLARTGTTVSSAGDVDGDGLSDLLLQGELRVTDDDGDESYGSGRAYLIAGASAPSGDVNLSDATATFIAEGTRDAAGLGLTSGDYDNDGYSDVVVGAPYAHATRGRVYVLAGGVATLDGTHSLADASVVIDGSEPYSAHGWNLASGDVTGDGIADLAVGAPLVDAGDIPNAGAVSLYTGGAAALGELAGTTATWHGEFDDHQLGTGLTMGSDVDGDGLGDIMMGAVSAWRGLVTRGGRVYVVAGRESGWPEANTSAGSADASIDGASVSDYLGRASASADLNHDGAAEIILASGYVDTTTQSDAGRLYLFWGGAFHAGR